MLISLVDIFSVDHKKAFFLSGVGGVTVYTFTYMSSFNP